MAEQTVNFRLKATNDASPALAKVADEMRRLNHEAVTARAGVASWGSAWGSASTTIAGGAKTAGGALDALGNSAKGVAAGGFQQLLSTIPGVGGALANLAQTLGGFPLLLGGIAAAGLGVLKFLQGLGQESDAALAKVTALAEGIGAATRQTALEVQSIRAQAAGDKQGALEADTAREIAAIEDTKNKRIAAAKAELDALDLFGRKRTELSQEGRNEILAAEADAALKTLVINEKKKADLKKLDDERLADEQKNRDAAVKKEEEAAEKTKKLAADTKASISSVAAIFKDLGPAFEDTAKKLALGDFVQKNKDVIAELQKGLALGTVTQAQYAEGTAALTKRMQDAIALGYVPTIAAAKDTAAAVTEAGNAAARSGAQFGQMAAEVASALAKMDQSIAKQKAAVDARQPTTAGDAWRKLRDWQQLDRDQMDLEKWQSILRGDPRPTGIDVPGQGIWTPKGYTDYAGYKQYLADEQKRDWDRRWPGMPPAPTSEWISQQPGVSPPPAPGAGPTTHIYNVSVTQSGTVIQQDRDWRTLVDTIRQSTSDAY